MLLSRKFNSHELGFENLTPHFLSFHIKNSDLGQAISWEPVTSSLV